jgi:hypothetical protein
VPKFIEDLRNSKASNKCLFLDELDKARREVADTILSLVTSPELFDLPNGVEIIAAANPPEWGGGDGYGYGYGDGNGGYSNGYGSGGYGYGGYDYTLIFI